MNRIALDIIVELVTDDVISDRALLDFGGRGRPASAAAGQLYSIGAMNAGRAAGLAEKAAGGTRESILEAVSASMRAHSAKAAVLRELSAGRRGRKGYG